MFKKYRNRIRARKIILPKKSNNIKRIIKLIIIIAVFFIGYKLFFTNTDYNEIVEINREFNYQNDDNYDNNTTAKDKTNKNKPENPNKNNDVDNVEILDVLIPKNQ